MVNNMAGGEGRVRLKIYQDDDELVSEFLVTPTTKGKDVVNRLHRHVHGGSCYLVEVWQGCERLVGGDENLLCTLLDWADDLNEVRFQLRYKEENSTAQLGNVTGRIANTTSGLEHQTIPGVVVDGSRMTVNELRTLASRQQQEIALKEKELKAKDEQLKKLKQEARKMVGIVSSKYLQELEAQAELQDQRLKKLHEDQKEAYKYNIKNISLAEELENARLVFASKQSELAMAVARVESLTKQLEDRKKNPSSVLENGSQLARMRDEIERLEKELLTRNELNHQQSVQLQAQKQLLAEKHKELFDLDSQIYELTNELKQKQSNESFESLNYRAFPSTSHGSDTENLDTDDLYLDDCDITNNGTGWEINCDLLDNITPLELSSPENVALNGFHPSVSQDSNYYKNGGFTNYQKNVSSSGGSGYIDIGPSTSRFQHVRPKRLEVLCEEEEGIDGNNGTTDFRTNNDTSLKCSSNSFRVAKIKTLFETELDESGAHITKYKGNSSPLLDSNNICNEKVDKKSRKTNSIPSNEKDHLGKNEELLGSPTSLELFDIENVELDLSDEEESFNGINSPVCQTRPSAFSSKPSPIKITPVTEMSPLSSPSSLSSMSSFSSLSSSTRVPAYSGVDHTKYQANHSLSSRNLEAKELHPRVTEDNATQVNKTLHEKFQPKMTKTSSVQPSKIQAVVTQIRTIGPCEAQTGKAMSEKEKNTPKYKLETAIPFLMEAGDVQHKLLNVTQTTSIEKTKDASQTQKASYKAVDTTSRSGKGVRSVSSVVPNNIQVPPTFKQVNAISSSVTTVTDLVYQCTKSPHLPTGVDTGCIKEAQQTSKTSTVIPYPSVKELVSAFSGNSKVPPKDLNQEVETKRLDTKESVPKRAQNLFYLASSNGSGSRYTATSEPTSSRMISSVKVKSESVKQEKEPAKPTVATAVKCRVDETIDVPESMSREQLSTITNDSLSNPKVCTQQPTSTESIKESFPTKEDDSRLSNASSVSLDQRFLDTKAEGKLYSSDGPALGYRPINQQSNGKVPKRVSLDPHAVFLDASVEGELDLVKNVIHDVEDPSQPNSDGITALHNAVCGNHEDVVKFLVESGCDINLPDSHGWTPLHCAAANNNLSVAQYLTDHGACIFATTLLQQKTPSQCCEKELPGYQECSKYLDDVEQNLGLTNNGLVYALYSYVADEKDELSFERGDDLHILRRGDNTEIDWWWAQNSLGQSGYVPRNLLGMHARTAPEV